jgi:hypothetical protein
MKSLCGFAMGAAGELGPTFFRGCNLPVPGVFNST